MNILQEKNEPLILDYERILPDLKSAFRLKEGEFIINRSAFRWVRDNMFISNAYESTDIDDICEMKDWEVVVKYGEHIAICKNK